MTTSLRSARFVAVLFASLLATGSAFAQSCTAEVGAVEAQDYVDICIAVSPATRPPCNADNPCQLIWDEISRGCAMLGSDAPRECDDYLG